MSWTLVWAIVAWWLLGFVLGGFFFAETVDLISTWL